MKQYHPILQFAYFFIVIGCSMFFMHPVCLGISFIAALFYTLHLFGAANAKKGLLGILGLMLFASILNPAFSHQGVTFLAYLPTGNILTLESIFYGIAAAFMLAATLLWFRCMNEIITSDKVVYLFGKTFPALSLILSMVLGFIPKMQKKIREIRLARQNLYIDKTKKPLQKHFHKIKQGIENLSILVTWALDDAVDMADSMKSRGYGLDGRTAFTTYRFTKRDSIMLCYLFVLIIYIIVGALNGGLAWDYYPITEGEGFNPYSISIYMVYLLLCLTPILVDKYEEIKWNSLQLKI